MKYILAILMLTIILFGCSETNYEVTEVSHFKIAKYEFKVYNVKTIEMKTRKIIEQRFDTLLVNLDCEEFKELCDDQDYDPSHR